MNWFYRWLRNKLNSLDYITVGSAKGVSQTIPRHMDQGMNFSIHRANGGCIVQYSQYDKRSELSEHKLHIITDDKDLGEELAKIITLESLRG